jgi:hypothetical protein
VDLDVELLPINGTDDLVPGDSAGWVVVVNRGPLNKPGPVTITLDVDAQASDVILDLGGGYVTCDAGVAIAPGRSRFTCTAVNDDFLQVAMFTASFSTGLLDGGRVVGLRAEARASGSDPTPDNNIATAARRISDDTDLVVSYLSASRDVALLSDRPGVDFQITNAVRGVARNARIDILVDLPPSAVGVAQVAAFGQAPPIWTCLPAVADGEGARIACAANGPFFQPDFPKYEYAFFVPLTPPLRAGVPQYTVTTRVTASSDSEEQVPADNSAQASFVVDQTTDIGIGFSAPLVGVAEPGQAIFPLRFQYFGPNQPRNARVQLAFDSELAPADVSATDGYGVTVACAVEPAVAGSTLVQCPIASGSEALRVAVRTNPDLAEKGGLALEATVTNDLVDSSPANNTVDGTVSVLAVADLCIGPACGPLPPPPLQRLEPDRANSLVIPLVNRGPSTARDTVVFVRATLSAARLSGSVDGQACEPVDTDSFGFARLRCDLGDLPGDGALRSLQVGLDFTGFDPPEEAGEIVLALEIESATWDPDGLSDNVSLRIPYAVIVDLSARVSSKRTKFPAPVDFMVEVGAEGPATTALGELVLRIESPGATGTANLWFDGPGWGCSAEINTPDLQQWLCPRYLPLDANSRIRVEVPAHGFGQIGHPIRVTATHRYRDDALAVDRTPGNDTATAVHVVDGRSTQSVAPKPGRTQGAEEAPRAPSRLTRKR